MQNAESLFLAIDGEIHWPQRFRRFLRKDKRERTSWRILAQGVTAWLSIDVWSTEMGLYKKNMKISALRFRSPALRTRPISLSKDRTWLPTLTVFAVFETFRVNCVLSTAYKLRGGSDPTTSNNAHWQELIERAIRTRVARKQCKNLWKPWRNSGGPLRATGGAIKWIQNGRTRN